ncbi:helix-turn-helix domain-containing protein [Micromonospora sp. NPDC050200]|uniref:helix-turn-helix domain-containing protein n=1 Tax=Micromonospora sp. NPDC050200 TaxID=3155664 RepID=UPI00340A0DE7
MSQHVKAALLATKGLGKNERAVAVAIAAHMNKAGDAWPSVATIAEYADCSERTVQRAIAKLINLGRLAWRRVADIPTRVYRLVLDAVQRVTSTAPGVTNGGAGVPDSAAGGDSQGGTRSGEEGLKEKPRGARDWRRWIPKTKNTGRPPYPERRGAALPPPPGGDRCQRPGHVGQPAGRCIPCLSEQLGGAR